MATSGTNDSAKLSSLFGKKKKGGIKSMNANVIAKENVPAAAPGTVPVATPASSASSASSSSSSSIKPKPHASPPRKPQAAPPSKGVADLSLGDKKDAAEEKREFQWAKQPKKYKSTEPESVARSWAEQEERHKVNKRINLQSERAFPTLGADATQVQLSTMKAPQTKAVATKNVWASLHDDDE